VNNIALASLTAVAACMVLAGQALAGAPMTPPPPGETEPLTVAEGFLAARNARDPFGATWYCADPLEIHDPTGQRILDEPATRAWLQALTDTYVIDTLVPPRADGAAVMWTERFTPRNLPFRDALAQSTEVRVEIVVREGKIRSYTASAPVLGLAQPVPPPTDVPGGLADSTGAPPSPGVLFVYTALALGGVAGLIWRLGRGRSAALALLSAATGLAFGFTQASVRLVTPPAAEATSEQRSEVSPRVALAQAFTSALNAHDVDALVELFSEEDAGATVSADRYAWGKFEIRMWAEQQVRAGIQMEAYDYQDTAQGAAWNANVYRDDWLAAGLTAVPVRNSISVLHTHVADFTSRPREPGDLQLLGRLWQPGAAPERIIHAPLIFADGGGPEEPLEVVASFLAARDAGDAAAAAEWCAPLLELHDVDGQWFVDVPTTSDWLRQLTDKYVIETLRPPQPEGNTIVWTERLSPRRANLADPWASSMTLKVYAVIRDGQIASLSAPYPPLPFRRPVAAAEPAASPGATVAPATLFGGTALGLAATVLLIARGGPAVKSRIARRA
jgi:hypothetical protein